MIGLGCAVVIPKVAANACRLRPRIFSAGMTLSAGQPRMRTDQGKGGRYCMVKTLIPSIHAMTCLAARRKSRSLMIDQFCIAIIADVTEGTIRIESPEQTDRSALVTALALQGSMSSDKREPVLMAIYILHDFTPSANTMALLAVASELTAMDIRVAISALGSDSRKNQRGMTLSAVQICMHSFHRKSRAAMIKVRKRAGRLIACRGMTIPACYFYRAMRIVCAVLRWGIPQR